MDKKLRLMVVDDNPHARKALAALFSTQDWLEIIGEASDGEDAIEKVGSQAPHMILMDAQMPVMDGLQATRVIKNRWPWIKVIILTLYADYEAQARQAGADAFLVKGCSMAEMTSAIRSLAGQLVFSGDIQSFQKTPPLPA